jgi:hypothetical protein
MSGGTLKISVLEHLPFDRLRANGLIQRFPRIKAVPIGCQPNADERPNQAMKLIFVYNAESGKLNALFDIAHKIIKPETYQCSLCALTHDALSEKKAWSEFKASTKLELEFLHKDEFEEKYNLTLDYPVVMEDSDPIRMVMSAEELGRFKNVEALIQRLSRIT